MVRSVRGFTLLLLAASTVALSSCKMGLNSNRAPGSKAANAFSFLGLLQERAKLDPIGSRWITLVWDAPTNAKGPVTYNLYSDATFTTQIAQVKTTSFTLNNPELGSTYTFGVRAQDNDGEHENWNVVYVPVTAPPSQTPPVFAGLKFATGIAQDKIQLKWDLSTDTSAYRYNIYFAENSGKNATPIGFVSFDQDTYIVNNLLPNTTYNFVVRCANTNGVADFTEAGTVAKSAQTYYYQVPNFGGLTRVSNLAGVDGLTKLNLSWIPSTSVGVTGYVVYYSTSPDSSPNFTWGTHPLDGQNFSSTFGFQYVAGAGTNAVVVDALDVNTTYYFVVRAFIEGDPLAIEGNRVAKSGTTLSVKAPSFAGANTATPGAGLAALSQITVSWPTPNANGVFNNFRITYQEGKTCGQAFDAGATVVVADAGLRAYQFTGLTAGKDFLFQVNTQYEGEGWPGPGPLYDTNTKTVCAKTVPPNPVFNGISTWKVSPGAQGFTSLDATWTAATSSFTRYAVYVSATSNFATLVTLDGNNQPAPVYVGNPSTQTTALSRTITSLPTDTQLYAKVCAEFTDPQYLDENNQQVVLRTCGPSGSTVVKDARTRPLAPKGEYISDLRIDSPTQLRVFMTPPTNGGLYTAESKQLLFWAQGPSALTTVGNMYTAYKAAASPDAYVQANLRTTQQGTDGIYALSNLFSTQTLANLTTNTQYCFLYRVHYFQSPHLMLSATTENESGLPAGATSGVACKTPALIPPSFNGIVSLTVPISGQGFTQLTANYAALATSDNFSYYQVAWLEASEVNAAPYNGNVDAAFVGINPWEVVGKNRTNTTFTSPSIAIDGLKPGRTYFAKVRGVHEDAGQKVSAGGEEGKWVSAITQPKLPLGGQGSSDKIQAQTATSIQIKYTPPQTDSQGRPISAGGLFNKVFILVAQSSSSSAITTFHQEMNGQFPAVGSPFNLSGSNPQVVQMNSTNMNMAGKTFPLLLWIDASQQNGVYSPNVQNIWTLSNMPSLQNYYVHAIASYWEETRAPVVIGSETFTPQHFYLESSTQGSPTSVNLQPIPLQFAGVDSLSGTGLFSDFNSFTVHWQAPIGDCTKIKVKISTSASDVDFTDLGKGTTLTGCTQTQYAATGLDPKTQYHVRVQAINDEVTPIVTKGESAVLARTTKPPEAFGDGVVAGSISYNQSAGQLGTSTFTYTLPTGGFWNKVIVFRHVAANAGQNSQGAVSAAVLATNSDPAVNGAVASTAAVPGQYPVAYDKALLGAGPTYTFTDTAVPAGVWVAYRAVAVYDSGQSSTNIWSQNSLTVANQGSYNAPYNNTTSGGIVSVTQITPDFANSQAKLQVTFAANVNGGSGASIDKWQFFIRGRVFDGTPGGRAPTVADFDLSEPWQEFAFNDPTYDSTPTHLNLLVGGKNNTPNEFYIYGRTYFKAVEGTFLADQNTKVVYFKMSDSSKSNWIYYSRLVTNLGYDFYMTTFEVRLASGAYSSDIEIATDADGNGGFNLYKCNEALHVNGVAMDSRCYTAGSPGTAKVESVKGVAPATNVTWNQAFDACRNSTSTNWYQRLPTEEEWRRAMKLRAGEYASDENESNCAVVGGANPGNTGANANCKNAAGVYDGIGRVREWVGERLVAEPLAPLGRGRFGFAPTLSRKIYNGIDGIIRKYQLTSLKVGGSSTNQVFGLALGSSYVAAAAGTKKMIDAETEVYLPVSTADAQTGFRCVGFPKGVSPTMDQMALAQERTYVQADYSGVASSWTIPQNRYIGENRVEKLTVNVAAKSVTLTWQPWTKQVCDGSSCSSALPPMSNLPSFDYEIYRLREPRKTDIRYATPWALSDTVVYTTNKPLDPLAHNNDGTATYLGDSTYLVGSVSHTACNLASPAGCTFTDSSAPVARGLFRYFLVVKDTNTGALTVAREQHSRGDYFALNWGLSTSYPQATFRSELRSRLAGIFPVDSAYVSTVESTAQIMTHITMDVSGWDHDYYIQRYRGRLAPGSANMTRSITNAPAVNTDGSNDKIGECNHNALATGDPTSTAFSVACGGNTNTAKFGSEPLNVVSDPGPTGGTYPLRSFNTTNYTTTATDNGVQHFRWADTFKACANSKMHDLDSNAYYLHMVTNYELYVASDWGDIDEDGLIDVGANAGRKVREVMDVDLDSNGCEWRVSLLDDGAAGAKSRDTGKKTHCVSRYGVAEPSMGAVMVMDRGYSQSGTNYALGNGLDGLSRGITLTTMNSPALGKFDLSRGTMSTVLEGISPLNLPGQGASNLYADSKWDFRAMSYYFGGSNVFGVLRNLSGTRYNVFYQQALDVQGNWIPYMRCTYGH